MHHPTFGDLTERQRSSIGLLERNINRLARLVQDLLEAARMQSGKIKLALQPVALADLVRDVAASFEAKAQEQGVALDVSAPSPVQAVADASRINQVLFNLVHNALKFTPRGGRVTMRVAREGPLAVIEVADTGLGLTAEQQGRMFQPFSQVHDARSLPTAVGGTGLGLYISRGILEQHGGSIGVRSEGRGRGSTFRVELPSLGPTPSFAATAAGPAAFPS